MEKATTHDVIFKPCPWITWVLKASYELFTLLYKNNSDIGKCNSFTIHIEKDVWMHTARKKKKRVTKPDRKLNDFATRTGHN